MPSGPTLIALILAAGGAAIVLVTGQASRGGAVAGLGAAALSILGFGPGALPPLATFVLGGGALTRLGRGQKQAIGAAEASGGRRGIGNVLAKLGLPALLGAGAILDFSGRGPTIAYAAALAGAFADTAATEVGPLGGGAVYGFGADGFGRLRHGAPGGVSLLGLGASLAGAAAVAGAGLVSGMLDGAAAGGIVTATGFVAALLESIVGGTPLGRALGDHGRNFLVSAVSVSAGYAAGSSGWGAS